MKFYISNRRRFSKLFVLLTQITHVCLMAILPPDSLCICDVLTHKMYPVKKQIKHKFWFWPQETLSCNYFCVHFSRLGQEPAITIKTLVEFWSNIKTLPGYNFCLFCKILFQHFAGLKEKNSWVMFRNIYFSFQINRLSSYTHSHRHIMCVWQKRDRDEFNIATFAHVQQTSKLLLSLIDLDLVHFS